MYEETLASSLASCVRISACTAEVPPLPIGFAGLTVPFVTLLSPSLPQQLNAHFLVTNNTLSAMPLYFVFIGAPLLSNYATDGLFRRAI